ncbi:MAG TPA: PQQ-binding-like beta-propeller repeat protein [Thermoanaerobaculia bacterium]|nr:PQQ-binding-like beta-propeller repeat protein [Thermoanaerobaculia bacterium]
MSPHPVVSDRSHRPPSGLAATVALLWSALAFGPAASGRPAPVADEAGDGDREWSQWRGPDRDGISGETGLLQSWPEGGPRKVIDVGGLGAGYSSFAASGDRLFTQGAKNGSEWVIALDARTGVILWQTKNGPIYEDGRGDGPRGTPVIDGDRLFAMSGRGHLLSLELESGEVAWKVDLLDRFGARNISWGISESPLVVDGKVIVNPGGRGASIVALERDTGEVVWKSGSDRAGYSSPMLAEVGGVRQAIVFTHERVVGVALDGGEELWSYSKVANDTANVATPVVEGNLVFVSSDYGTGGALLRIGSDGRSVEEVYFTREMKNHHSSPVLVGGALYGFSSSILTALDFDTGEVLWRDRSVGKGSLIYGDGRLYLLSERGAVALAEATPAGYRELGRFQLPRGSLPSWSHPILHDGRLILRDQDRLYAFDVRGPTP